MIRLIRLHLLLFRCNFYTVPESSDFSEWVTACVTQGDAGSIEDDRAENDDGRGHVSIPHNSLSSLSIPLHIFPHPYLWGVYSSVSQRQSIWSSSHGAKDGANPALSQQHTQKHTRHCTPRRAPVWWHQKLCFSHWAHYLCIQEFWRGAFPVMQETVCTRLHRAGKESLHFKKKSASVKCPGKLLKLILRN